MATRSIVTSQPDVACDVCMRRLLRGERPDVFVAGGQRLTVCELCAPRAAHQGWLRESEMQAVAVPPARPRRGQGLLARLRRRGESPESPRPAEPVVPVVEPAVPVGEPAVPVGEPAVPVGEPVLSAPAAEPATVVSGSAPALAESAPAVGEPMSVAAEPATVVSGSAPALAESAPAVGEPMSVAAEPVSTMVESVHATAEPVLAPMVESVEALALTAPADESPEGGSWRDAWMFVTE